MYQLGKRFTCDVCGSRVLVTKASDVGELRCCDTAMTRDEPKVTASGD